MIFHSQYSSVQSTLDSDDKVRSKTPWWLKIVTSEPKNIYYFGSFNSKSEAIDAIASHIADLESKQARGFYIKII